MTPVKAFLRKLQDFHAPAVFNPWRDLDLENDLGPRCPKIRSRQLEAYLSSRLKSARLCLLGEALSYQGGHFSGIAMMSERILLGHHREKGLLPETILPGIQPARTSRPELQPLGFTEHTASMVWGLMTQVKIAPLDFLTWNSFAWHPYNPKKGMLSNRRPTFKEAQAGLEILKTFLRIFPRVRLIAVGKIAEHCLRECGIKAESVRHPAMGGATQFRTQMKAFLKKL